MHYEPDIGELGRQVTSDCTAVQRRTDEFGHFDEARTVLGGSVANSMEMEILIYVGSDDLNQL